MNANDLIQLGVPAGDALKLAHSHLRRLFARGVERAQVEAEFPGSSRSRQNFTTTRRLAN